ncbi:hypothetical protein EK21DRAFT_117265 [Setomelanomma holmii]|uniref:Uncharacterized protein n=1 Tax=Setomelanomma holmii TaxID=210430 RepID=A0A9P4H0R3_9PLEO|nr:hypothetical protein EK21DRAFT_117265 [Setomelanomma holmii]
MPSRYLTPSQLVELKKGPKTNVVIGPKGDPIIGIEGVSIKLLAHFSPWAKKKLIDDKAVNLCIPNGSREQIRWI